MATNCFTPVDYTIPCYGISGIQKAYLALYNDTSFSVVVGASASNPNMITSFSGTSSFYAIQQDKQQGSLTTNANYTPINGSVCYDHVLELTFIYSNQLVIDQINGYGKQRVRGIVLDSNGLYWMVGLVNGLSPSAGAGGPGKAYTDVNGFVMTLTGTEASMPIQVSPTALTGWIF
jgi:hypothetical protein